MSPNLSSDSHPGNALMYQQVKELLFTLGLCVEETIHKNNELIVLNEI